MTTPMPRLVLMCGLPGAGKTTEARRLGKDLGAVRLAPDEWMDALGIDLWDEARRTGLERIFWDLAQELLRLGTSVILESGFWLRSDRDEKRTGAHAIGAAVELRHLDVPIDELMRRLELRSAAEAGAPTISRDNLERFAALFQAPDRAEMALLHMSLEPPADSEA
jgi:predicted kinase